MASVRKLDNRSLLQQALTHGGREPLLVLIKLRAGVGLPAYVRPRSEIGRGLFSAEITVDELRRLQDDPAIEAISISQQLPPIA